ncbi:DUF2752 domain-containing protein [Luteococcus sp.]|uniref:DUF2752 domain-containing protein n=1 Tax=Luteococcus sp. TaxID=1969402 RepID=UPI0037357BCD
MSQDWVSPVETDRVFDARDALRRTAALGGFCLAQGLLVAVWGRGLPCPLRAATGLLCPVCGATTAGIHLLHGEFGHAWAANPVAILAGLLLAVCVAAWTVEALGGPAPRPLRRWAPITLDRVLLWSAAPLLVFTVVRNLG